MGSPSRKMTMNNPGTAGRLGQAIQKFSESFRDLFKLKKRTYAFVFTPHKMLKDNVYDDHGTSRPCGFEFL